MKTFNSEDELFEFLEENICYMGLADRDVLASDFVIPVFVSSVTDDPHTFMRVHKWFDLKLEENFCEISRRNLEMLEGSELNLYKFAILCCFRGPLNEESFAEYIGKLTDREDIQMVAKHSCFPADLRAMMYEKTGDTYYLPPDAQDIFVF